MELGQVSIRMPNKTGLCIRISNQAFQGVRQCLNIPGSICRPTFSDRCRKPADFGAYHHAATGDSFEGRYAKRFVSRRNNLKLVLVQNVGNSLAAHPPRETNLLKHTEIICHLRDGGLFRAIADHRESRPDAFLAQPAQSLNKKMQPLFSVEPPDEN